MFVLCRCFLNLLSGTSHGRMKFVATIAAKPRAVAPDTAVRIVAWKEQGISDESQYSKDGTSKHPPRERVPFLVVYTGLTASENGRLQVCF